jgi:hypothetical protein
VSGVAYGVQGGYNWQFRCTLFGIEADYNWTNIDHDFVRTGPLGLATLTVSSSLQSFGTVRARSGVIVDNLLLYVTGGLAYAHESSAWVTRIGVNYRFGGGYGGGYGGTY